MASKRPVNYKPMDLPLKYEILQRLRKGESASKLSDIYKIPRTTVNDIKKNGDKIENFMAKMEVTDGDVQVTKRIRLTHAANTQLDDALYLWFVQQRSLGVPLSGPILMQKALEMNVKLKGDPQFKASTGWLGKFKLRHGIRQLSIQGEVMSANSECVKEYCENLVLKISRLGLNREQVYNCDESGLYWKALPTKTLASGSETSAPGYKMRKERLTIMVCANASGNHKLPLAVIGKSMKPRALKNVNQNLLPVHYYAQKNSWMNQKIFIDWFQNVFVVQVKKYLKSQNLPEKALLIMDNAPSHPLNELDMDENIKCVFLPANTTSLIQPMDQGVIENLKRHYRKIFLQNFICSDSGKNLNEFWKGYTIKHSIFNVADAWNNVSHETLSRSWNKLWPSVASNVTENNEENQQLLEEVSEMCTNSDQIDKHEVSSWLNMDSTDVGYEILNDNEIIEQVLSAQNEAIDEKDDDEDTDVSNLSTIPCKDVEEMLTKCIEWYEQQSESNITHLIAMRQVRALAIKKGREKAVQKRITDFFKN